MVQAGLHGDNRLLLVLQVAQQLHCPQLIELGVGQLDLGVTEQASQMAHSGLESQSCQNPAPATNGIVRWQRQSLTTKPGHPPDTKVFQPGGTPKTLRAPAWLEPGPAALTAGIQLILICINQLGQIPGPKPIQPFLQSPQSTKSEPGISAN